MFGVFIQRFYEFAVAFNAACDPNKDNPSNPFFGFPHWWKYIHSGKGDALGACMPVLDFSKGPNEILAIVLAIIDMLLRLAGLIAVISIIIAGIGYITAAGSSDKITASRKRIVNSIIGLAVALVASAAVAFIGNRLS